MFWSSARRCSAVTVSATVPPVSTSCRGCRATIISATCLACAPRPSLCSAFGKWRRASAGCSRMCTPAGSRNGPISCAATQATGCTARAVRRYDIRTAGRCGPGKTSRFHQMDHRAAGQDHAGVDRWRIERSGSPLHDRDHDAAALRRARRRGSGRRGRDRNSLAQSLAGIRCLGGRRGHQRDTRARRHAQAFLPSGSCEPAHRPGGGCLDLWIKGKISTRTLSSELEWTASGCRRTVGFHPYRRANFDRSATS